MKRKDINPDEYDYELPHDRVAQYPVIQRDTSKLLILQDGIITEDVFNQIDEYLPPDSLLVFNNSRVIKARLLFGKQTGAIIEILCLEPLSPPEYNLTFQSKETVEWKCIVGNLKKWKSGPINTSFNHNGRSYLLEAEKIHPEGEAWRIKFRWNADINFGEVIEAVGHVPLPPYINREDGLKDASDYQTVYSRIKGSIAAPTAGLHFTDDVLQKLRNKGIETAEITLHVGAGTFKPMKTNDISEHEMHCEHFFISAETIESILKNENKIIAVGTTTVRTIESIYWLGIKVAKNLPELKNGLNLGQWEAYELQPFITVKESLNALLDYFKANNLLTLHITTRMMVVPGYKFRIVNGLVTNFHQPKSTLLLLVSAWAGEKWREIYNYALENNFRFLSYGDSSLLLG